MISCWQRYPENRPNFSYIVTTLDTSTIDEPEPGNQFAINQSYGLMDTSSPQVNADTGYIEVISGATSGL